MILASPTHKKQRGAFYTPRPLADFLVRWAVRGPGDRVLDPACGEAVFLEAAVARLAALGGLPGEGQVTGCEIDADAAAEAGRLVPQADILPGDFFALTADLGRPYEAVVGNPPYVRYHYFDGDARAAAIASAHRAGVELSALASSWAPFVVHSAAFLSPGGRLALVLPAELLGTDYAGPVRAFLRQRFARVDVLAFEARVFPGALVDAVLLLAEGEGPGDVRVHRLPDAAALDRFEPGRDPVAATEPKWTYALASAQATAALATAARDMVQLGEIATVDIGLVTGGNRFFLLSDRGATAAGLASAHLRPVIARGHQMPGYALTNDEWERQRRAGEIVWLFAPDAPDEAANAYIRHGEDIGVHLTYKCRIRKPWWKLKTPAPPDMLLSYMSNRVPRLVANDAGVVTTNLLHNVRLSDPEAEADLVALSWLNSATMLACELGGRAYGGGVLKLETREAERVPVPRPNPATMRSLRAAATDVDGLLRAGMFADAADLIDEIVLADLDPKERFALRSSWLDLQDRRRHRAARPGGTP